jgi:hypothetical protein
VSRARIATVAFVGLAAFLGACGGAGPAVSDDASARLGAQVTAVRAAVAAHDAEAAAGALATLRRTVGRLRRSGEVSAPRAAALLAAAGDVEAQLTTITTTTTTATTTTTTTPPAPPTDDHRGKGKVDGKGKGSGEG